MPIITESSGVNSASDSILSDPTALQQPLPPREVLIKMRRGIVETCSSYASLCGEAQKKFEGDQAGLKWWQGKRYTPEYEELVGEENGTRRRMFDLVAKFLESPAYLQHNDVFPWPLKEAIGNLLEIGHSYPQSAANIVRVAAEYPIDSVAAN